MKIKQDLTGNVFGRLTVVGLDETRLKGGSYWICTCTCGNTSSVREYHLRVGATKSCGCYNLESIKRVKRDLTGQVFTRLTVLARDTERKEKTTFWLCQCSCSSAIRSVGSYPLISGKAKSCGCLMREKASQRSKTHGESHGNRTKEYKTWEGMRDRCRNENGPAYRYYGGRGITVSPRWENSYENFLEDMGRAPTSKHSIDRIDNNKGYSKENCRWATKKEQASNTRRNVFITHNGRTQSIRAWSAETGISEALLRGRRNKGFSTDKMLFKGTLGDKPLKTKL